MVDIIKKEYSERVSEVADVSSVASITNLSPALWLHNVAIRWYSEATGTTLATPTDGTVLIEVKNKATEQWEAATNFSIEADDVTDLSSFNNTFTEVRATPTGVVGATHYRLVVVSHQEGTPDLSPLVESIEVTADGNVGVGVFVQDQTTQAIDIFFHVDKGDVTTATVATQGQYSVDLDPGHGAAIGDIIISKTAENYVQALITNVVGDTITVNTPWSRTFPIGTTVELGSPDLNVLGSTASPVIFHIDPSTVQNIDITRIIINIIDDNNMDFTTFGGLTALTNGCALRKKNADGNFTNYFAWRSNDELIERSFDHTFQSKFGGGSHGFVARSTWAGQDKRGVAIRVNGANLEELQILVQDDLTGLDKFRVVAQGHIVQQ